MGVSICLKFLNWLETFRKEKTKLKMTKRTQKVGITGKYATRYGASLRKTVKKMEVSQHATYTCPFCGKDALKRQAVGIWHCKGCRKTIAGGAWSHSTTAAVTVRSAIRRLREIREAAGKSASRDSYESRGRVLSFM